MKKTLLIFFVLFGTRCFAQQPAVGTMTLMPTVVTQNSILKIITTVTTPAQGVLVDKSYTVTQNPNVIQLRICYGSGMLPATFAYVDTFNVGLLPVGNYSVHFRAYMSSANQWCNKIDSNEVSSTLTVNVSTALSENKKLSQQVFVAESGNTLVYNCGNDLLQIEIYNMNGKLESSFQVSGSGSKELRHLKQGMYFLRFAEGQKLRSIKFSKE